MPPRDAQPNTSIKQVAALSADKVESRPRRKGGKTTGQSASGAPKTERLSPRLALASFCDGTDGSILSGQVRALVAGGRLDDAAAIVMNRLAETRVLQEAEQRAIHLLLAEYRAFTEHLVLQSREHRPIKLDSRGMELFYEIVHLLRLQEDQINDLHATILEML